MARSRLQKTIKAPGKEILKWAERNGWSCEITKGCHLRYTHPKIERPYFEALTPSDYRGVLNCKARLRRAMLSAGFTPEQIK